MKAHKLLGRASVRELARQSKRHASTTFRVEGGRSSVSGVTATVFGCTGFLGRYVVNKLGRVGTSVIVPHREYDEDNARHLKLMGDLGMINPMPFHARDTDSIARVVEKSDVVINLLGKQMKTRKFDYVGSNVEAVTNIAKVCKEVGVPKFVHVSAVAASESSSSEWLRCKAMGEASVRNYYPDATVLRSNVMFGEEDTFLNQMAKWTKIFGFVPIMGSGTNRLQPVYVDDVAECVRAAVFEGGHAGKTYELNGPEMFTTYEISRWVQATIWRKDSPTRCVPDLSGYVPAALSPHKLAGAVSDAILGAYPGDMFGPMSMLGPRGDCAAFNSIEWVPNPKLPQMEESFRVSGTPMQKVAPEFLRHYRQGGHYSVMHKEDQSGINW